MDKLINFGGAVKALGDGRVGGYLVLFGDEENTDVSRQRDFFTAETDFDIPADGAKSATYYRHALDSSLDRKLTDSEMKVDEVGVWVEGVLDLRDRYEKALYGLATKNKLGWSSGTAEHLVKREKQENGAHKILRWPLGLDASLTPDPAEPRTQVVALKSLLDGPALADLCPAVKAQFLGEYVEQTMTMAALRALNDALMYDVLYRCVCDTQLTQAEKLERLRGALQEFVSLATESLERLLAAPDAGEMKALQLLWGPSVPESLHDHSAKVVTANAEFASRLEGRLEARTLAGRTLSDANLGELKSALDSLGEIDAVRARLTAVLETAAPEDVGAKARALTAEKLRQQIRGSLALYGHQ